MTNRYTLDQTPALVINIRLGMKLVVKPKQNYSVNSFITLVSGDSVSSKSDDHHGRESSAVAAAAAGLEEINVQVPRLQGLYS